MTTATFHVPSADGGIASAIATTQQQTGTSLDTALLNTVTVSATTHYLIANTAATLHDAAPSPHLGQLALIRGYTTTFWWTTGTFVAGAINCGTALRRCAALRRGTPADNDTPAQNNPQTTVRHGYRKPGIN